VFETSVHQSNGQFARLCKSESNTTIATISTSVSILDAYQVQCSIWMVWNLSMSFSELELITRVLREAILSICAPSERLLVSIWVRWVVISGRGRDGDGEMDRVCEKLAFVRGRLSP